MSRSRIDRRAARAPCGTSAIGCCRSFGLLVMLLALAALAALLYDVARDGLGRLSWQFLTSYPSRRAEDAGILAALVGSIYVIAPDGG